MIARSILGMNRVDSKTQETQEVVKNVQEVTRCQGCSGDVQDW